MNRTKSVLIGDVRRIIAKLDEYLPIFAVTDFHTTYRIIAIDGKEAIAVRNVGNIKPLTIGDLRKAIDALPPTTDARQFTVAHGDNHYAVVEFSHCTGLPPSPAGSPSSKWYGIHAGLPPRIELSIVPPTDIALRSESDQTSVTTGKTIKAVRDVTKGQSKKPTNKPKKEYWSSGLKEYYASFNR